MGDGRGGQKGGTGQQWQGLGTKKTGYPCFSLGSEEQGLLLSEVREGQQSPRDGESRGGVEQPLGFSQ